MHQSGWHTLRRLPIKQTDKRFC